ncbi:hypothetical protein PENSPDRAFT_656101 [Peniophora sp. CONT]|nr:hypothetical protein PENSPDRAFT_656101 [Peniophora sp. CONT]
MNVLSRSLRLLACSRATVSAYLTRPRSAVLSAVRLASTASTGASPLSTSQATTIPHISATQLHQKLASFFGEWSSSETVRTRLRSFGIASTELNPLLSAFSASIRHGSAWRSMSDDPAHIERLWNALSTDGTMDSADRALNQLLYSWVADNASSFELRTAVSSETIFRMVAVANELDYRRLANRFSDARRLRRKIIMHVGPTNSGKTHNALSALAAARSGQYMGPLRLLAFEIFSRLNSGQIVPLGADPASDPYPEPDEQTNLDAAPLPRNGQPALSAIRAHGDPRYARKCSMITGEERRDVKGSTITACTVEMCDFQKLSDVAVIDEIQMIADPDRGRSWTAAVLGVPAREVHICGEESAVPLVEALLRDTGDDIVVNRYQRLSPLRVADEPLGDLSNVQEGDCVVAFSRSRIFAAKAEIERRTKLRCAVAYGRLPPDVRSEQAALFNDPNSGFDVLVGSDALGMGLNLKIRRVIFTQISKYSGLTSCEEQLSNSAIKQIGGRAGRFGLHEDNDANIGIVTTLKKEDLPAVKAAFDSPITPLAQAYVDFTDGTFARLIRALPPGSSAVVALDALTFCSRLPPHLETTVLGKGMRLMFATVDSAVYQLTARDREDALDIPCPSSKSEDDTAIAILELLREWSGPEGRVDITRAPSAAGLLQALDEAVKAQQTGGPVAKPTDVLTRLETLHKVLVAYAWAFWKWPSAFYAHSTVISLLRTGEQCMNYMLGSWAKHAIHASLRKRRERRERRYVPVKLRAPAKISRTAV